MPISGGCKIVLGWATLTLWLHFFLHVWFYPLWETVSLARGIFSGIWWGTLLLLPLKMLVRLSQPSPEVSPCSGNCGAVIATPGLTLQQNIFQGMFFNKNTFPRTPATKEIKEAAWLIQRQLKTYMSKWIGTEIIKESEDCSENNSCARYNKSCAVLLIIPKAVFRKYPLYLLAFWFLVSATANKFSLLSFPQGRGCNWKKRENELNRTILKANCSFSGFPNSYKLPMR